MLGGKSRAGIDNLREISFAREGQDFRRFTLRELNGTGVSYSIRQLEESLKRKGIVFHTITMLIALLSIAGLLITLRLAL
jgi:hypothetical protein